MKNMAKLLPILLSFYVMGFVDMVGVSTSYVKQDFSLSDTLANLLPMLVFLWFAVCSLPAGMLTGKIGRKKTVLLSTVVTFVAMLLPIIHYSYAVILLSFACLGIGNTILQVSLNPLLASIVNPSKLTSMLSLGTFIKAIASMGSPLILGFAVSLTGKWQWIFPIYSGITLLSAVWLWATPFEETIVETKRHSFVSIIALLKNSFLLQCFLAIVLSVGFEIGLMTAVPTFLFERFEMPLEQGGMGCSLYYLARMSGTFIGSIVLAKISPFRFIRWNLLAALLSFVTFVVSPNTTGCLVSLFLLGLCCANIFPIMFSAALQHSPENTDNLSALMIMGIAGGAILPMIMGAVADMSNQTVSLIVPFLALVYIYYVAISQKDICKR